MIVRMWTGWTRSEDADAYEEYMREVALDGYQRIDGNQGVLMLRRDAGDGRTEFTMVSMWRSIEDIRAFAGENESVAVFYPRDDEFLVDRETTVRHYHTYGATLPVDASTTWAPEAAR